MTNIQYASQLLSDIKLLPNLLSQVSQVLKELEEGTLTPYAQGKLDELQKQLTLITSAGQKLGMGDLPWELDSLSKLAHTSRAHHELLEQLHTLRINLEVVDKDFAVHYVKFLEDYDALESVSLDEERSHSEKNLRLLLDYIQVCHISGDEHMEQKEQMEEQITSIYPGKIDRHIRYKHLTTSNQEYTLLLEALDRTRPHPSTTHIDDELDVTHKEEDELEESEFVKDEPPEPPSPKTGEEDLLGLLSRNAHNINSIALPQSRLSKFLAESDKKKQPRSLTKRRVRARTTKSSGKVSPHINADVTSPKSTLQDKPLKEEARRDGSYDQTSDNTLKANAPSLAPEEVTPDDLKERTPIHKEIVSIDDGLNDHQVKNSEESETLQVAPAEPIPTFEEAVLDPHEPPLCFEEFAATHWLTRERIVEPVPWRDRQAWETQLLEECLRLVEQLGYLEQGADSVRDRLLAQLWIHARVLQDSETHAVMVDALDVEQIRALLSPVMSVIPPRSQQANPFEDLKRRVLSDEEKAFGRFKLVLEALSPRATLWEFFEHKQDLDLVLSQVAGERYLDLVLKWVLTERLLKNKSAEACLLDLNQSGKEATILTEEECLEHIERQRVEFHAFIKRNWQAGGGKVQHTHCRDAWSMFVQEFRKEWETLYPHKEGGVEKIEDTSSLRQSCDQMMTRYAEIVDYKGVKFHDLNTMNRIADELVTHIGRLCDRVDSLNHLRERNTSGGYVSEQPHRVDPKELKTALESSPTTPFDRLARLLIQSRLGALAAAEGESQAEGAALTGPPGVGTQLLWLVPELLGLGIEIQSDEEGVLDTGDLRGLTRTPEQLLEASALILTSASILGRQEIPAQIDEQALSRRITDLGLSEQLGTYIERFRRDTAHRALKVHTNHQDHRNQLFEAYTELSKVSEHLTALSSASSNKAKSFLEELDALRDVRSHTWVGHFELIEKWISQVKDWMTYERDQAMRSLRDRTEPGSPARQAIEQMNYAQAVMLLQEGELTASPLKSGRACAWRKEATPLSELEPGELGDEEKGQLLEAWRQPGKNGNDLRVLRNRFTQLTFRFGQELSEGSVHVLRGEHLYRFQQRLRGDVATFLPIVDALDRIEVLTPEFTTMRKAIQSIEDATRERTAYFYLIPGLEPQDHEKLIEMAKRSRSLVAILDDTDLTRLISCPRPELALFEILLEQQPLDRVNPFHVFEGSRTSMSMFVGRRTQAQEMAYTPRYTRLFSGRKLGKTALLKYIAATYNKDEEEVPEGERQLRVIYISIAGVDNITTFRRSLFTTLDELDASFSSGQEDETIEHLDQGEEDEIERLLGYLRRFLARHQRRDFLIVFDEADMFVESELAAYEEHQEKCLTFQLRSNFNRGADERAERIRFVFSGYRRTNTRAGTWANWGDVLMLDPLQPQEAAELISVPFARMGIDVTEHAKYIAFQCGYQPAILLRFGNRLVSHLHQYTSSRGARSRVRVKASDVRKVYNEPQVRNEIRTVVENNFQGNPTGLMIFRGLLAALEDLPPASSLEQPDQKILRILKQVANDSQEPDLLGKWLEKDEPSQLTLIQNHLREFRERSLIDLAPSSCASLKYPHHLPILIEQDVREHIRVGMQQPRAEIPFKYGRTLLGPQAMDSLETLLEVYEDEPHSIVFASAWRAPFVELVGLPQRFGSKWERWKAQERVFGFDEPLCKDDVVKLMGEAQHIEFVLCEIDHLYQIEVRSPGDFLKYLPILSEDDLAWWFTRVRGFEFDTLGHAGVGMIHARTGGIPWFVGHWDELIMTTHRSSDMLGHEEMNALVSQWEQKIIHLLRQEYKARFKPRERQLFEAVLHLEETGLLAPGEELEEVLADPELSGLGNEAFEITSWEDRTSLRALVLWGFIALAPGTTFTAPRYVMGASNTTIRNMLGLG